MSVYETFFRILNITRDAVDNKGGKKYLKNFFFPYSCCLRSPFESDVHVSAAIPTAV